MEDFAHIGRSGVATQDESELNYLISSMFDLGQFLCDVFSLSG